VRAAYYAPARLCAAGCGCLIHKNQDSAGYEICGVKEFKKQQ